MTAPVLGGLADGAYISVWCSYCKRDHQHGRHDAATGCRWDSLRPEVASCTCPPGTGDGHRVAHCHDSDSPYADTGYIVKEILPGAPVVVSPDGRTQTLREWVDSGPAAPGGHERGCDVETGGDHPVLMATLSVVAAVALAVLVLVLCRMAGW